MDINESSIRALIRIGNTRALVIDKELLRVAGLDEDTALFQMMVDPNGGIIIRSLQANENAHEKAFRDVLNENDALMQRLSKQ